MAAAILTATEFQDGVGDALDRALVEPLVITKHGKPRNVILSYTEYERLIARDRRVITLDDWTDEDLEALANARMEPGLEGLNAELDG
jgi:prevent-host-death family protein